MANLALTSARRLAFARSWSRVAASPVTVTGLVMLVVVIFFVGVLPSLLSTDPDAISLRARLEPPSWDHLFGTDEVGRDIFTRVMHGGRVSIGVALFVVAVSTLVGTIIGGLSGILGGKIDTIVMRVMDVVLAVPSLVLTMALAAALGPSLINAMVAIAVVRIPTYVRLSRGQTLVVREAGYVMAARVFGARPMQILRLHVVPNILSPVVVQSTLDIGAVILMVAGLSFIGLGAQPPAAEWGAMVSAGRSYILDQWWYSAFPGLAILFTSIAFNLLGDGIRDLTDPRQKGRS
jgi:peptide/nickel transport system permease protein